jgi:formylmethanofuran dehydrogenase subunit C
MTEKQKTVIIDGEEVPVIPAKAEEEVKNKRTGKVYASKTDFDNDVADSNTDTVADDLQINQKITVASLTVFGKTKS